MKLEEKGTSGVLAVVVPHYDMTHQLNEIEVRIQLFMFLLLATVLYVYLSRGLCQIIQVTAGHLHPSSFSAH